MRGLRRTVLGVLATAVTAAGVLAPTAAQAATTSIRWETWSGTTLRLGAPASVCGDDWTGLGEGQTVVVQVMLGGVWTTKQQITVGEWESCVELTPSDLVSGPGTYYFRALFRPAPSAPLLTASTAFTLVKQASSVEMREGPQLFSYTTTPDRSILVRVYPSLGQYVDLQRKVGDAWIGVSRVKADTGESADGEVRVPVPTRSGLSRYRAVVRPSTWSGQSISTSVTMHQTDMAKHRSYLISARGYMSRFCPNNPIHIDTTYVQGEGNWGRIGYARSAWSGDESGGEITTRIDLRSGLPMSQLRSTALHECAHAVQTRAYVEGKHDVEDARARNLWPRVGHEGQADCMAFHVTRNDDWLGYVSSCTSTQLSNAQRMWQDYGLKYQAHPYRWGNA